MLSGMEQQVIIMVAHGSHGTTKYLTAQPNNSHSITKYLTAQPNISRHNQIAHGGSEFHGGSSTSSPRVLHDD